MKKLWMALTVCSVVLSGFAALPAQAASKNIYVVFDRGTEGLEATHVRERNQLGDWMDKDLVRVFARYSNKGFEAQLIAKAEDYQAAPGNYLLNVRILEYNAGSKATRMLVGFGAGGMTLKVKIELLDHTGKSLLSKEESCFSGREWRNIARKVNELIAASVTSAAGP
jgi:hypothetical protein